MCESFEFHWTQAARSVLPYIVWFSNAHNQLGWDAFDPAGENFASQGEVCNFFLSLMGAANEHTGCLFSLRKDQSSSPQ